MPNDKYDYYTLRATNHCGDEAVDVLGWGTYPRSSVLAGQPMKVFLGSFPDAEEAQAKFPEAKNFSNKWTEPQVSLSHLPGEDDYVPGGALPDDWTDSDEEDYNEYDVDRDGI